MIHVRNQKANIEPVFFTYPDDDEINAIVDDVVKNNEPDYDFTAADGFGHHFWVVRDAAKNQRITELFAQIPALYVADGHHRTAAAARVGLSARIHFKAETGFNRIGMAKEEVPAFSALTQMFHSPSGRLTTVSELRGLKMATISFSSPLAPLEIWQATTLKSRPGMPVILASTSAASVIRRAG